jgi:capsular exopolysaccharide synthesis family protein
LTDQRSHPIPAQGAEPGEIDLLDYLRVVRRRWKLVAAVTVVSLAAAGVHYLITPKAYQARAMVQIERRNVTSLTGDTNPWMENFWNLEYYPTQYLLLQSRGLAELVVERLHLAEDPGFNPAAAVVETVGDGRPNAGADRAALGAMGQQLLGGLRVVPRERTQLVDIYYTASDPEFAARAANGFAETFIDMGIEDRTVTASRASTFIGQQIEELKDEIQDKEDELRAYSRQEDVAALDPGSKVIPQQLEALNRDYISAVSERIDREARYNQLLSTPRESAADTLSGGLVGQMRSELLALEDEYAAKLQTFKPEWPAMKDLEARIAERRGNLETLIEETVTKARQQALGEFQTAKRRQDSLDRELRELKSQNLEASSAAVEYQNLQLEISTRRELLDELMRKQSETGVASRLQAARESNVRIIDAALVPGAPFMPSLRKDLSLGLMVGLIAGVGLVLLIHFFDRSIKSPEELERWLGLPTLAVIPDVGETGGRYGQAAYGYGAQPRSDAAAGEGAAARTGGRQRWVEKKQAEPVAIELAPHDRPRQVVSEAYRSLRTALLLSSADRLEAVAITSADSGEGKTATATNLGVVMAQLGRRVLLVDADLRKPRLHEVFQVSNQKGLVSYLTGTAAPEQTVVRTGVPNLSLVPSGPIPPNPSELLGSERMGEFLKMARERFDLVIVDTPPALAVTDATVLGARVDGVVLCFRAAKVLREDARACRDRLLQAEVKILGTVLNRMRATSGRYGSRYRQYAAYGEASDKPSEHSAA